MPITKQITEIILKNIPDATAIVTDPQQDGVHFQALVISATFIGMPLVKQHQMVLNSLKEAFKEKVHALALKTFTPEKWESQKENYSV
ncbi:MAG: BolA family transcriptional regulator [Candidatus Margulisbacteria bacterium]|nr:BolA family transcriptional regulator [Candidatus Margulisiibacteriota bacterium]